MQLIHERALGLLNTGNALAYYRSELGMTQAEAAKEIGCTQSNYSKWEKNGIPSIQRKRVLEKIVPFIQESQMTAAVSHAAASARLVAVCDTNWEIKSISKPALQYLDRAKENWVGEKLYDIRTSKRIFRFFCEVTEQGIFDGKVLQAFVDGVSVPGPSEEEVMIWRLVPIGIDGIRTTGVLISAAQSILRPRKLFYEIHPVTDEMNAV